MDPVQQTHVALTFAEAVCTHADRLAREKSAAAGYTGLSHQSYLPVHDKREFSPEEEERISAAKGKLIPKIFTSLKDNPEVDMATPWTPAVLMGLLGAGGGGILGAGIGGALSDGDEAGQALGGGLGALAGGLGLGALGYHGRKAENESIEEMMSRFPEGASRRDIMSDPVLQSQAQLAAMQNAGGVSGGNSLLGNAMIAGALLNR